MPCVFSLIYILEPLPLFDSVKNAVVGSDLHHFGPGNVVLDSSDERYDQSYPPNVASHDHDNAIGYATDIENLEDRRKAYADADAEFHRHMKWWYDSLKNPTVRDHFVYAASKAVGGRASRWYYSTLGRRFRHKPNISAL